jgi:hypothetical protein
MVPVSQPVFDFAGWLFSLEHKENRQSDLIFMNCRKCKNLLFDSDIYCPICGAPATKRRTSPLPGFLFVFVALVVIICFVKFKF